MSDRKPLLVVNIAGLSCTGVDEITPRLAELAEQGTLSPVQPTVPALTSTSQATLLTGTRPDQHGIVANGWYFRDLALVLNWQRSARLVTGTPLWDAAPQPTRCANLFWRYATHATAARNVTERPTYWVDGRKGPDIYCEPGEVRDELVSRLGPFPLFNFWGPFAGIQSTRWIVDATIQSMQQGREGEKQSPPAFDLVLTYLPHLDYDHQRFGPDAPQGVEARRELDAEFGRLLDCAERLSFDIAVVSDYAFEPVNTPVYLNRVLREQGWLVVQRAENGELLEPGASRAFAVCDQQVAHVYVRDRDDVDAVRRQLSLLAGVDQVLGRAEMGALGLDHDRAGELLVLAAEQHWFAYPYWLDDALAPDFDDCVAIHVKPGFDPRELFPRPGLAGKLHLAKRLLQKSLGLRIPFDVIDTDATRVGGSHGRIPASDATRPLLLTSWRCDNESPLPMECVRDVLLARLASAAG